MSNYPRQRQDFPAAEGWIVVSNGRGEPVDLLIEPSGLACDMPPGAEFYVHISPERSGHPAQVEVKGDFLVVYGGDAVYRGEQEVIDLTV